MPLTADQIEAIVARALPGERLRESRPLSNNRHSLTLTSGERLDLYLFAGSGAAASAVAALRRLRGEVDLPLPLLRASDVSGDLAGGPWLLANALEGDPLAQMLPRISDEHLNAIGRRLGEVIYRIHKLACERFGSLASDEGPSDERRYVLARLETGLQAAGASGVISAEGVETLRGWFEEQFQPIGGPAALVCGGLTLNTLLVRPTRDGWSLSGVLGWDQAVGWTPAWDHTVLLESARATRCFALRVGYGNAYDAETQRSYEQLREAALRPYRLLLALEQAHTAQERGDEAERDRNVRVMEALLRLG